MFQTVINQFAPGKYGSLKSDNDPIKWNVIVASIEGFLSGVNNWKCYDIVTLVNILNDCELDVERENRSAKFEENVNLGVLNNLGLHIRDYIKLGETVVYYRELPLSELKTFRNDKEKLLQRFNEYCL